MAKPSAYRWPRLRYAALSLLLVLASFSLATYLGVRSQALRAHAAPSVTGLHVSGNQLLNGQNQVVRALGVDRSGAEYMCRSSTATTVFDGPVDTNAINAMLSWDITAVRIPLNEDCWLGINGYPAAQYSAATYQQQVVNFVNTLTSDNLIVILDLHWNAPGTQQANGQQPMPDLDHAPAFWTSVANTFKNNSSVIFDLYNEPYTSSWACWRDGSTAANASPCSDVGFAVAGMQTLINTVRATGATNVIMLGGLAYANDLSQWLQYKPTDPLNNLVASFHLYNFNACSSTSCWNSQVAPVAAQVPVIAGEIGENDCAHGFIDTAMAWFDQHGISYLGWAWDTYDCSSFPALISNYNGTPTAYGQGLHDHLIALASGSGGSTPTPAPTPSPTPTTAPSPTPTPTPRPTVTPTATPSPTPSPTPGTGASCQVHYSVVSQWPGGFQASISITNTGSSSINGWTLSFSFTAGQQITQLWNGSYTQQGAQVTITNASYNAQIPAGGTLSSPPGFLASWNGSNPAPTSFTLNGVSCSVV
ncbi:MAG: cellulose binding domain-containing protein [Thermogemmatispora sp.]|uniref:cellulase family glycosylhydrolase n=1 Tax=Thermogemmatispora sp. TaxID=1968838 RepID=UPI00260D3AD7|nr:cellulase family glycosylhydrolase [Thermogemmatispora sp.]MBX5456973.1 cellulose binding domain-containing protein [Thermogemmatispora sp.]